MIFSVHISYFCIFSRKRADFCFRFFQFLLTFFKARVALFFLEISHHRIDLYLRKYKHKIVVIFIEKVHYHISMLIKLKVQNFAIIEDIELDFKSGLTVLTGETGAGKSLIIDCIGLLLGERAASEMIRQGEDKAIVSGVFDNDSPMLRGLLEKLNIPFDGLLDIKRTISNQRNIIKINDETVSLGDLKTIASLLADIHLQFDSVKLFAPENYLSMVDGFSERLVNEYLEKYRSSLEQLKKQNSRYNELVKRIEEFNKNQEEYAYAYQEINALQLSEGDEQAIEARISILSNYDKIYALSMENKELADGSSLEDIYRIKDNIDDLQKYDAEYQEISKRLNDAYFELEDIYSEIKRKTDNLDYDPAELDSLIEKSHAINTLKKKYNKSFDELIAYANELKELLKNKEDHQVLLNEEKEKLSKLFDETYEKAFDVHKVRENIAIKIAKEIEKSLGELGLTCRFDVVINAKEKGKEVAMDLFNEDGIDTVDFNIETNIGEGMKPLAKVVSGGELSRVMLAIKMLYVKSHKIGTIIFDEIDTGISGEIANKVAKKIKELSYSHQVITITHLPQVASLSDHHIRISKNVVGKRTFASAKELTLEEKIYEIASLISAGKVTDKQLEYAKELVLQDK